MNRPSAAASRSPSRESYQPCCHARTPVALRLNGGPTGCELEPAVGSAIRSPRRRSYQPCCHGAHAGGVAVKRGLQRAASYEPAVGCDPVAESRSYQPCCHSAHAGGVAVKRGLQRAASYEPAVGSEIRSPSRGSHQPCCHSTHADGVAVKRAPSGPQVWYMVRRLNSSTNTVASQECGASCHDSRLSRHHGNVWLLATQRSAWIVV